MPTVGDRCLQALSVVGCVVLLAPPVQAQGRRGSRLDSQLHQLSDARASVGRDDRAAGLVRRGNTVAVTVHLSGAAVSVTADLLRLGATIANVRGSVIETYVPVAALRSLESLPGIGRVDPIVRPRYLVTSQGVSAHNADTWHAAQLRGQGVKVGIIDSFDNYAALIGTELPVPVGLRCYVAVGSFTSNLTNCGEGSVHGTAVAETLVDVAPDVQLYLADPQSLLDFRASIEWMISQGVRIINHSAAWSWQGPGDGTSPYSNGSLASADFAASQNTLFVSAAGNEQRATWTGTYADGDADQWLEFNTAGFETNSVTLTRDQVFMAQARWEDSWTNASRDIDLYLFNESGQIVAFSENTQEGLAGRVPHEFLVFFPPESGTYYLALRRYAGTIPGWIQAQAFTGNTLQFWVGSHSIANPAESAHPGVLAVGATHWSSNTIIASYSSLGPTRDGRVKPDIVGVASADTVSYGPGGFAGTSQATPHAAGLAALVLGANPSYTAAQLAAYLKSAAQPRGTVPNNTWGHGFAYLPAPPCVFALSQPGRYFVAAGGGGSTTLNVNAESCAWTASSDAAWLTLTSASSGSGSANVTYSVASNTAQTRRSASLTIGGQTHLVRQAGVPAVPSPDDINGDGWADLLLQHDDGWLATWIMDERFLIDGSALSPDRVDPSWRIVGMGDANGDGKPDIYWQHQFGALAVWLMNGTTLVDGEQLTTVLPQGWRVRTVTDLSGDGKPDLVLQHDDGWLATWYLDRTHLVDGRYLTPNRLDPAWHVVGSGDADADGMMDLFFQNQVDGALAVWFMDRATLRDGEYLSPIRVADQGWRVRGVGDFDADGRPDLLWQHTTGAVAEWLLNGATLKDGTMLAPPTVGDPRWRMVGPR